MHEIFQLLDKAKSACENAGSKTADHFVDVNKMVEASRGMPI